MIRATCTWGDGPDVLIRLEDDSFVLYEKPRHRKAPQGDYVYGYVTCGSMELTADEALDLSIQLLEATRQAKQLDDSLYRRERR